MIVSNRTNVVRTTEMAQDVRKQLTALKQTSAQARAARERLRELEARRNDLVIRLRQAGVRTCELAEVCGLTPGRVTQIADL
jgi:hypothetical protein